MIMIQYLLRTLAVLFFSPILLHNSAVGKIQTAVIDWRRVNVSLAHSANSYCDPSTYLLRRFLGSYLSGFVPLYAIRDLSYDVDGYIGYDTEDQDIYIVFRGSSSFSNYWVDASTALVPYPLCERCQVHEGFLAAQQAVSVDIHSALVDFLFHHHLQYPQVNRLVITGHSLGGALATLTALHILNTTLFPPDRVDVITFGSPRVGNTYFASYASLQINYRITHHQDVVPHLPLMKYGYMHIAGEWYQPNNRATLQVCVSYVPSMSSDSMDAFVLQEDETCSQQWYLFETSVWDHLLYLTTNIGEEWCSSFLSEDNQSSSGLFTALSPQLLAGALSGPRGYFAESESGDRVFPGSSNSRKPYEIFLVISFILVIVTSGWGILHFYYSRHCRMLNKRADYIEIVNI